MAESNNPSIFVLGGLKPKKTLKKTVAYHVEDYQAFEKLYSLAKPGQGQKWIGAWKSDDTRLHHLVDDEWGTVVSFGCDFGFDSNYNKNDGSFGHNPTLAIGIEKIHTEGRLNMPLFLSTNVSFKMNNVDVDSTSLDSLTPLFFKEPWHTFPYVQVMQAPDSLKGKAASVDIIVTVQVDIFGEPDGKMNETVDFEPCKEDDGKIFIKRTDLAHLSDVKIKTKSQELDCHKLILSLRSEVFRAMFEHGTTTEAQKWSSVVAKEVVIEDFNKVTVGKMIDFIYDGHVEDYKDDLLLQIADKYNIKLLKQRCEMALSKDLDDRNVAAMWVTADFCQASLLKQASINYMINKWDEREQFEGMKEVMKKRPRLIKELVVYVPLKTIGSENLEHAFNDPKLVKDLLPILLEK